MRVLVCGGRDFCDSVFLNNFLYDFDAREGPITVVIHGSARGADSLAMYWAQMMDSASRSVKHAPFAADWRTYGKAAGSIRNQRMLDEGKPEVVIAFDGGTGTADMVRRATLAGIRVVRASKKEGSNG